MNDTFFVITMALAPFIGAAVALNAIRFILQIGGAI